MRFAILGPLQAWRGNEQVPLGPFKQRLVLGMLLCRANQVVPVSVLTEAVWESSPPRTAQKNLQVYVSTLRRLLTPMTQSGAADQATLTHTPPGYTLHIGSGQLDAIEFQELSRAGRRASRDAETAIAADLLGRAVRLWRGPTLLDLTSSSVIVADTQPLEEEYLSTCEDWAEAMLAIGGHTELVEPLADLTRRHPYRERLRYAYMVALYRSGRQAEALAQFDQARQLLARELGIQPSPVLVRLYESMLVDDPGLALLTTSQVAPAAPVTLSSGRTSLTRDLADFTGRGQYVERLNDLLNPGTGVVVVVSGGVGMGKTTLAVHSAHQLGGRFPDGRVMVGLRATDGRARPAPEVVDDLLHGLGVMPPDGRAAQPAPNGTGSWAALLRQATWGRRILLILDDAVSDTQVRELLDAVGDTTVVVTSRRFLGGIESAAHIRLESMPDDEAWQMLRGLIGAARVAAQSAAGSKLVEICAGVPLLLRIVGAKLNGLPHVSPTHFLQRLTDERHVLDQFEVGDLRLRDRLAAGLGDLSASERTMLRHLASRPGAVTAALSQPFAFWSEESFSMAEATARLGTDPLATVNSVERLLENHLIEVCVPKVEAHSGDEGLLYRLPWPLRIFALESIVD